MRRWLVRLSLALVILLAVATGGVYAFLHRALPQVDGTITVTGVSAPVEIIRDADSITHVFGATKLDTYFGLGYAHAQGLTRRAVAPAELCAPEALEETIV